MTICPEEFRMSSSTYSSIASECFQKKIPQTTRIIFFVTLFIFIYLQYHRKKIPPIIIDTNKCSLKDISSCQHTTNRTFLYILWASAGFGSELNQVTLALGYSVYTKRRFLIDTQNWNYGRFSDYFNIPFSKNIPRLNKTFLTDNNLENQKIDHLKTTRFGAQLGRFWKATRPVQSLAIKRQVAHFLWKSMTNDTLTFIQTHQLHNLSNYIGIHVRRGDKIRKEAKEIPLQRYITNIEQIYRKHKQISKKIFVASDDYTVIHQLRTLKPNWNFVSLYDSHTESIRKMGHFQGQFNRLSKAQKLNETRLLLCELQMLIDAQYVLCGMSSNICRLVQILRYQNVSTVISMDRTWYPT